jgi:SAM-dependent methyltransferase
MNDPHSGLFCPSCRVALNEALVCPSCDTHWPAAGGIADFSRGVYYDNFNDSTVLTDEHRAGLALEMDGARRRIVDYYLPRIPKSARRVLDCGCGNGISVDLLNEAGFEAWGNDLSALRKWQWRERQRRDRLVVASALELPFADEYFDVVISSGVIEHIGVEETSYPRYTVRALPNRDELRRTFFRELLRVLEPGGALYVDCPNGRFPIDFWHSDAPGRPRFHPRDEPFLPSFAEIERYVPNERAEALSPYKRLQFHQAARHWYGRLLGTPMSLFFRLMPGWIAASALNPFLVVRIRKSDHKANETE